MFLFWRMLKKYSNSQKHIDFDQSINNILFAFEMYKKMQTIQHTIVVLHFVVVVLRRVNRKTRFSEETFSHVMT